MNGRRILVTGAAQGIGRAVAARLAADGERPVLLDSQETGLHETADLLEARHGARPTEIGIDVSKYPKLLEVAAELDDQEAIDALVNVAGIGRMSRFSELSLDQWLATFEVNVTAPFVLGQLIGGRMADRGHGWVVNMASIAGKSGSAELADYCASKAALISLTQSMARAFGPSGVNVNAVCPGLVWTPMWHETASWLVANEDEMSGLSPHDAFLATVKASTPLQRPTRVEDIAAAVSFLLSENSQMITGQAINVDGGIEIH